MSSFISPEPVAAGVVFPFDPDESLAADVREWADAAEREGRVRGAEVLRRMVDDFDCFSEGPRRAVSYSLSAEEFLAVVGRPESLDELEAASARLGRLAACVPVQVREDRRLVAALGAEPGGRVVIDGLVYLVAADRRLVEMSSASLADDERREVMSVGSIAVGGGPVPAAGTADSGVLAAWFASGGARRAWLARVALADCEAGGSFEEGVVLPWGWPAAAVRDALGVLYDPAGPWGWEAGPDPVRPEGPPKFVFRVSERTEGVTDVRVHALNAVEALAWFFKTSEERIREWMAGRGAPRYCESEHFGESWPRCQGHNVGFDGNVDLEVDCGCEPLEVRVDDGSFLVDGDHLSDVLADGAAEFGGKVYLEDDEVKVPEGYAEAIDFFNGSPLVSAELTHEQGIKWEWDYEYAPPETKSE